MDYNQEYYINEELKLAYFPVNKNASSTYCDFFAQANGWETQIKISSKVHTYTWFSHIQNPYIRYIKGITEIIDTNNLNGHLTNHPLNIFLLRIYHDKHIISISDLFGDAVGCVNFIPIDDGHSSIYTYDFLKQFGYDNEALLKIKNRNISTPRKKRVQAQIKSIVDNRKKSWDIYNKRIKPSYKKDFVLWEISKKQINQWPYTPTYDEYLIEKNRILKVVRSLDGMDFFDRLKYAMEIILSKI